MSPAVAVLADDLTGAADSGIGFRRAGLRTAVGWSLALLADSYDVVALDLATRGLSVEAAAARTASAVEAARSAGVSTLYKKVDSLLRGHLGLEVRAALDAWGPDALAIVAPAFPAAGRTTVDGWQLLDGIPIASVSQLLLEADVAVGTRAWVCDASTDEDLRAVARAGVALERPVVWVGTAGLAAQLPAALGLTGSASHDLVPARPVLTVVGSMAADSQAQLSALVAAGRPRVSLDELGAVLSSRTSAVLALDEPPGQEDAALVRGLAASLAGHASLVGGLVATGGETAASVLRAFGVTALELVAEVEPGLPLSVACGAWRGPVVTKAGAFGDAGSLVRAVAMLEGAR
jgi:D-threonate/D-erythronate kinase